jgi:hypothetical protein
VAARPGVHPIDELIGKAEKDFADVLKKESPDLKTAAAEYRRRRGRHPPPGFDIWYEFAEENNVIMVEDFFDQIYHDLAPFWGLDARIMRREAWAFGMTINIRNQRTYTGSEWFWTKIWQDMTESIQDMLPDMDLPLNSMDEPRVVTPWEEISELMKIEKATRSMPPPSEVQSNYQKLPDEVEPDLEPRYLNFTETCMLSYILLRIQLTCYQSHTGKLQLKAALLTAPPAKPHLRSLSTKPLP